jgi:hypothetical protein
MSAGIAPSVLLAQVRNTAAWALEHGPGESPHAHATSWRAALLGAPSLEASWQSPEARLDYLALLLAAHYATCGTFVPTDVDTRIRHHAWQEIHGRDALRAAVAVVDRTDAWNPRAVSARVVEIPGVGLLSGHDGEWLSVRAGALGRALQMNADELVEELTARIDAELEREARAFKVARAMRGGEVTALCVATTLAHNLGDLSRVVEEWPVRSERAQVLQTRYLRLGHEERARYDGVFALAGHVNKAVMAAENHRYLPLRKPRALRRARDLILPFPPFLDAWGEHIGRHRGLDHADRGAILAALLEGHEGDPSQQSYLRAIAGLNRTSPGGIDALAREVPARLRKLIASGPVREALRVAPARFEARMANRYRAALDSYPGQAASLRPQSSIRRNG